MLMLSVPFLAVGALAISWYLLVRTTLDVGQFDANYFANFMSIQAANSAISVTFSLDVYILDNS